MPKIRPKAILSRLIYGEKWKERNNSDYLLLYVLGHERRLSALPWNDDDDDDGSSIISTSTTATVDNQPGTGRFIDMYIFQPIGRRIERLAMRFTIASLHPACIAQYIEAGISYHGVYFNWYTLNDVVTGLRRDDPDGSTVVAGMKGLVKQTQSSSIDKSTSALAALIHVSLTHMHKEIDDNISRIENIFFLEALGRTLPSLPSLHPEKKWFILLVRLAKETVIAVKRPLPQKSFDPFLGKEVLQLWPSLETALNLRQRLVHALKAYRLYGLDHLEESIGEAFGICSVAISTCIDINARGDTYMHILETVYFTVVFVLRSIHKLADSAINTADKQIYMIMRTIACWLDAIVHRCLYSSSHQRRFDMDKLKNNIAFRSLALVDNGTKHMLLPESYRTTRDELVLDKAVLPRKYWEATGWCDEAAPIQSLIKAARRRTRRLLRSFDELEREVWGRESQNSEFPSQTKINADPFCLGLDKIDEIWWKHWEITITRARRARIENDLTEQFRVPEWVAFRRPYDFEIRFWAPYEQLRRTRHKWGQYLRSNMDWDWDLGSCMKRLLKIEKQTRVGSSPGTQMPEIDVDAGMEETLKISMGEVQGTLPREVQIAYKTKTGETSYLTFTQPCSLEHHSVPETEPSTENALSSSGVKKDSGCRIGSSDGELDVEDLEAGASSSVALHLKESEDTSVEESSDGYEGKDVGHDEVRVGDAISICSLD